MERVIAGFLAALLFASITVVYGSPLAQGDVVSYLTLKL
jgi:hypothetical protein